jgi:predicted kinase
MESPYLEFTYISSGVRYGGARLSWKKLNYTITQANCKRVHNLKEPFASFVKTQLEPRTLLITCGLPASYKTETAEEVSKIKGYPILRSDLIRLEVLKNEDIFDAKVAGNMNKRLSVYDEVFRRADEQASKSKGGLILDATFVTQDLRRRAAEIAAKNNMTFVILQTNCPQEVSLARIKKRTKEKYESNALTEEAYLANKNKFEPVDIDNLKEKNPTLKVTHLTVDTCHDETDRWYVVGMEKK